MSNGVEFELTNKEFMRLCNMYKKALKENNITSESYVFDDFICDVFTLLLKSLKYDDVDQLVKKKVC